MKSIIATIGIHLVYLLVPSALCARELVVDQRGGAAYTTLAAVAAAAVAGDTIILTKGSGPYREQLLIPASGTAAAPIIVEGNGETITGFNPITFTNTGGVWTYYLPTGVFATAPVVINWQGRRIPQDQTTGAFLGPVSLQADGRTLQLDAGTSTDGWEVSIRFFAVAISSASHHIYRNIIATGSRNDGFNLHGASTDIAFENITGHSNFDEGLSAHETVVCSIQGGRFWNNDNGIYNINSAVMTATDVLIHDNLGFGLELTDTTVGMLTNVRCWNNGDAQIRYDLSASGTASQLYAWAPPWTAPPWRRYNETKTRTDAVALGNLAALKPTIAGWSGIPQVISSPAAPAVITPRAGIAVPAVSSLISAAVTAKNPLCVLPAGTHVLTTGITITNASNLVIEGADAKLMMADSKRIALAVNNADHLTVKGLAVDYDPLAFTQGAITAASTTAITFKVHTGYPDLTTALSGAPVHLFKPDGSRHPLAYDFYTPTLTLTDSRTGTLTANGTNWPATLAVGDLVAIDRRNLDATNAVEVRDNPGPVILRDFTVLGAPALAIAGRYCLDRVTLDRVNVRPGPKPAGATQNRLLSSNADTLNFVQCRLGPLIQNSEFCRQGDDGLNVHGYFFQITNVVSPTAFEFTYPGPAADFLNPLRPGDTVRLQTAGNFPVIGSGRLASAVVGATANGLTTYRVTLASPPSTPLAVGQWFDIPEVNSPGYIVRDSYFHDHRGRGLRLMGNDGLVERNRFERLTKSAISIGPELGAWREAGWVNNVTVRDNILSQIGVDLSLAAAGSVAPGAIGVFVHTDNNRAPYPSGNSAIFITGNTISQSSVAGIHAFAVDGLYLANNTLTQTNLQRGPGTDNSTGLVTTGPISDSAAILWNGLHDWRLHAFGSAISAGTAADTADPDGDGIVNLLEFALGLNPLTPEPTNGITCSRDISGHLALRFARAQSDATYQVLASEDLVHWTVIATNPGTVGNPVTVTDTSSGTNRRFLRLNVTGP